MGNAFGRTSKERLSTAHEDLQLIHNTAIPNAPYDYGIAEGHRGEIKQNQFFESGASDVKWPDGAHNKQPSYATDHYIWHDGKAVWGDEGPKEREMMLCLCCYLEGVAEGLYRARAICAPVKMGYKFKMRNGGTDMPHIERDV